MFQNGVCRSQHLLESTHSMQLVVPTTVGVRSSQSCFVACSLLWNNLSELVVTLPDLQAFKIRVKSYEVYHSLCSVKRLHVSGLVNDTL